MSRRDRMRDLTIAEIKATARQQMAESGTAGVSLSAIARAMELSAPALYRYFASRDDLVTALIVDAFNDLADTIQAAESAVEAKTCALKIAASCLAYREWAIAHPVDFQLIYGNPIPGYVAPAEITVPLARRPFDGLARLFLEAYQGGELVVPAEYVPVPASITAHFAIWLPEAGYDFPDALLCLLMSGWARIHGMVMLELFEHLGPVVGDSAAFYRYELGAFLQQLGMTEGIQNNTRRMKTMLSSISPEVTFPKIIWLPNGWQPEGIASGSGTSFYVGSLADGAIYAGDFGTGRGSVLVPGQPGLMAMGLYVDQRSNALFVAGGMGGQGRVYDASSGALLRTYQFQDMLNASPMSTLVNDVIVTREAAYFTDSFDAFLYRVPLGPSGALPDQSAVNRIPLSGDFVQVPQAPGTFVLNANGIEATSDGKWLVIVQTVTGKLFRVDPQTGVTKLIDLGGAALPIGDGLLFAGSRLYVVQNSLNIAVVNLNNDLTSGAIERTITDPDFRVPSTIASFGDSLYAVNARFDTTPGPNVDYDIVKVPKN
jgi:AcrR family transcriptional regulator